MTIVKYRQQPWAVNPLNELVNEFFGRDISQFTGRDDLQRSMPGVNIIERADSFVLHVLAPGFTKEDLKLRVEDDTLHIAAERKVEDLKEDERYTRREYSYTSFERAFRLPENVAVDGVKAEFINGVLHVTIPKTEEAKPRTREISIG